MSQYDKKTSLFNFYEVRNEEIDEADDETPFYVPVEETLSTLTEIHALSKEVSEGLKTGWQSSAGPTGSGTVTDPFPIPASRAQLIDLCSRWMTDNKPKDPFYISDMWSKIKGPASPEKQAKVLADVIKDCDSALGKHHSTDAETAALLAEMCDQYAEYASGELISVKDGSLELESLHDRSRRKPPMTLGYNSIPLTRAWHHCMDLRRMTSTEPPRYDEIILPFPDQSPTTIYKKMREVVRSLVLCSMMEQFDQRDMATATASAEPEVQSSAEKA